MEQSVLLQIQIDTKDSNGNKILITVDENIKKGSSVDTDCKSVGYWD